MSRTHHYVLCQHGVLGNRVDFHTLVHHFNHPDSVVKVVVLTASEKFFQTLEGIEAAGHRCIAEIRKLVSDGEIPQGSTVSVLGHSMGGLVLRFALRELEIESVDFWNQHGLVRKYAIFIASPHTGILGSSWLIRTSCAMLLRHVSGTAEDLVLASPILLAISDDYGIASLNAFDRVVLYGNQARDKVVSVSSALVLSSDLVGGGMSTAARDIMTITEFLHEQSEEQETFEEDPVRTQIVKNLNNGLTRVSRFLVDSPSSLPSFFQVFDNTAHTRIIAHGLLDRSKVGLPMIEHLQRILGFTENVTTSWPPTFGE